MRFFGREQEIADLRKVRELSRTFSRFTVVTGRRRVGKTQLLRMALDDGESPYVHLVITRKPEKVQCEAHQAEIERVLGLAIPYAVPRFSQLFEMVMKQSIHQPLTLVLDEFQEFDHVDPGLFGEIAAVWDRYHNEAKVNLVVCGSVNRLIFKIFFDDSEPLYGRSTGKLHLDPFKVSVLKDIFSEFHPNYANEDLLALWTITGGVARYVELLMEQGAFTQKEMLNCIFNGMSTFLDEGRTILSEEFGKDYGVYFSILAAVASGRTTYAEIKNEMDMEVGGYLTKLEKYGLLSKRQPLYDTSRTKGFVYQIDDCFFRFWFRFVYRNQALVELRNYSQLLELVGRDFTVFTGYALERYFYWKFIEEQNYVRMGGWWDRKGENEIDLLCERALDGAYDVYEVKRDAERFRRDVLNMKVVAFLDKNPSLKNRTFNLLGLSVADM